MGKVREELITNLGTITFEDKLYLIVRYESIPDFYGKHYERAVLVDPESGEEKIMEYRK